MAVQIHAQAAQRRPGDVVGLAWEAARAVAPAAEEVPAARRAVAARVAVGRVPESREVGSLVRRSQGRSWQDHRGPAAPSCSLGPAIVDDWLLAGLRR